MPEHLQTRHFFTVTLDLSQALTREEAKKVLLDLLDRGRGEGGPEVYPAGEKRG